MHLQIIKTTALVFVIHVCAVNAFAQNMNSPYSVYGIGDIQHRYYNFNSGMGYTGLALKTSLLGAGNNPASISGIEKRVFMLDINAAGRSVNYVGNPITAENSTNRDFTVERLSLSSYITSFWASGIGMSQFSQVNYKFQNAKSIEGTNNFYNLGYSGDGGLNNYYWNNAFSVGKHLSLGVTASFIAGPINQTETISLSSSDSIQSTRRDYYANGRLEYGFIYSGKISKQWNASIGGRFSNKTKMNYDRHLTVTENSTTIVNDKFIKYSNFSLPRSFGGGIALSSQKGITVAADYSFDNWSALNIVHSGWRLINSNRLSGGIEFSTFAKSWDKMVQTKSFQLGGFINNSYLMVNNHQIMEWGATAGMTHLLRSGLKIGTSIEGGVRGTTQADLIKENYIQLNLSFSLRDVLVNRKQRFN